MRSAIARKMQQHAGSLSTYYNVTARGFTPAKSGAAMRRPKGRLPAAARHPQSAVGVAGPQGTGVSKAIDAPAYLIR
jgi:hypothetical protein